MQSTVRFMLALLSTSAKASVALRGAFITQALFMLANNLVFFVMWWILFQSVDEISGWRFRDCTAMYAIVAGAIGICQIMGGGLRELARVIADGDLDSYLALPQSTLLQALASKSNPSGWGDIMSSFVLLYWAEYFVPGKLALAAFLMCTGAVMFLAAGVIIHSTAFWAGPIENLARHAWEFVIAFSLYPVTIHTGFLKVMMFTLIPAGFISYFPVELLRDFSVLSFLTVLGATTFYSALALFVFARGLQQYESGNRIMLRT